MLLLCDMGLSLLLLSSYEYSYGFYARHIIARVVLPIDALEGRAALPFYEYSYYITYYHTLTLWYWLFAPCVVLVFVQI